MNSPQELKTAEAGADPGAANEDDSELLFHVAAFWRAREKAEEALEKVLGLVSEDLVGAVHKVALQWKAITEMEICTR